MKRGWDLAVGAAILVGALALRFADPVPLQQLRNLTFDTYQRLQPRAYDPDIPVVIAAIDEKSLDKFGQWPWSRTTLARIADRLTELGAVAITFDVLFAEPDRTSPTAVAANLPPDPQYDSVRVQLAKLPDPDAEFAAALARSPSRATRDRGVPGARSKARSLTAAGASSAPKPTARRNNSARGRQSSQRRFSARSTLAASELPPPKPLPKGMRLSRTRSTP